MTIIFMIKKGKTVHKIKAETQTTCYFAKPKDLQDSNCSNYSEKFVRSKKTNTGIS